MTTMPKTSCRELNALINATLRDLLIEAKESCGDHNAQCVLTIDGHCENIYNYIEGMCDKYNNENITWKCSVEQSGTSNEYEMRVYHVDDWNDRYGWVVDLDETDLS